MEMKHKITVKKEDIYLLGAGSGRRPQDRGEAAEQFNPSPISCENPLISTLRHRTAEHYMSLNPHYSAA